MRTKRILLILMLVIGTAFTARWWLPILLKFLSVNGDLIQAIDSGINLVSNLIVVISALGGYILLRDQEQSIETLDQRNRRVMLNHVENSWVKGVLEKSLHGAALLELGIKEDSSGLSYPWVIRKESANETLPAGKSMLEIFQEVGMERSLLILGAPGSGKTTMLLELARQLIERARRDRLEPIPIVFNLASWKEWQTMVGWLAEQLNIVYSVPRRTAPSWLAENRMILLLDGLDEVKKGSRIKCVNAINQFRKEYGLTSIVVCSRSEEYAAINAKLSLEGAITLQPLTSKQIDAYFDRFGESLTTIKQLVKKDKALRELAESPLMLSIMALAYKDGKADELIASRNLEQQRKHLFDTYIMQMFRRSSRTANTPFSKQQVLHYVQWLARMMVKHNIVTYRIESMQPTWLEEESQRRLYQLYIRLIFGLIFGTIFGLIFAWNYGLISGLVSGLVGGLAGVLGGAPLGGINILETLKWSVQERRSRLSGWLIATLIGGLSFGLIVGLMIGLIVWLISGQNSALSLGLGFGLIFGLIGGLGYVIAILIQHYALRLVLMRHKLLPRRLISFLDYVVDLIFLRRVGRSYIFVHRLLMEHFAEMDAQ